MSFDLLADGSPRPGGVPPGFDGLGLYRVHWKAGGWSLAAIGMGHDGRLWLAPTNWITPATKPAWSQVERVDLLATASL